MFLSKRIFTCCVFLLCVLCECSGLLVGSFNLKIFGKSKSSKPEVVETIVKIISRYDIILLMEIRDTTGQAVQTLQDALNRQKKGVYGYEISDRLGRSKSKEQYIFVYRKDRGINVLDRYHYDDGDEEAEEDTFEREPFVVRFHSNSTVVPEFALVGIHTNPKKALSEIKSLEDVFDDVKSRWNSDNIIVLGDLNADCTYVRKSHWPTIAIRNNPDFYWPIGDDVDTTITSTDCAYDRFVVSGERLQDAVVNNSAEVFDFPKSFKMSTQAALSVSDHFPIELELKEISDTNNGTGTLVSFVVVGVSSLFIAKMIMC